MTGNPGVDADLEDLRQGSLLAERFRLGARKARTRGFWSFFAIDEADRARVAVHASRDAFRATSVLSRAPGLDHPHVRNIRATGQVGRWHYEVTDRTRGEPLQEWWADRAFDPEDSLSARNATAELGRILGEALDALEFLHQHDIAHGWITPHSFRVTAADRVELVDLALLRPEGVSAFPLFASPERQEGAVPDARSDLYALAASFYTIGEGRFLFGADPAIAAEGHRESRIPRTRRIPPPIESVLRIALDKRPELRPASAAEMKQLLSEKLGIALADMEETQLLPALLVDPDENTRDGLEPSIPEPGDEDLVPTDGGLPDEDTEVVPFGTLEPAPTRGPGPDAGLALGALLGGALMLLVGILLVVLAGLVLYPRTDPALPTATAPRSSDDASPTVEEASSEQVPDAPPAGIASDDAVAMVVDVRSSVAVEPSVRVEAARAPQVEARATLPTGEELVVPVGFVFDSYLPIVDELRLQAFADQVIAQQVEIRLSGHTDSVGPRQVNDQMGLGRAVAVQTLLVNRGVRQGIKIRSAGEDEPIAPNDTEAGRAQNRRVSALLTE